ncbi:S-adenosyl-L-methionine-dependentmethyltransferases superfamily protein [Striga asiatica]|uniref:S-adenosyl-L-methionine-dependentmethyltransferases superfamily protein n=1 Tax=Striga asiatica TaxID=4170 RepID=A0A5A7RJF2_STRAF|nr:S-adenosyl-L-methionine-dependentmethyltransferases superfamily protein [Striga asiatica]
MAAQQVNVHMNFGNGDTSYTNNSAFQKNGILKAWHVLEETLKDMFTNHTAAFPDHRFRIADLGCSSGPNALFVISRIIGKIEELCKENGYGLGPELEVLLNDLPGNDFNNIFRMLPEFYQKLNNHENINNINVINQRPKTFIYGLPGSFYGRLVPSNSLNFVHSSYGLQWLSQVPQGLENNRENIHIAMTSPPEVFAAYYSQYKRDFTTFLESRAVEMVVGARMVLTFTGRSVENRSTKDEQQHLKLLSDTLIDMVQEGLVKEVDLHSFNMPVFIPSKQEVETLVHEHGSFNLDRLEGFFVPWDSSHVKHGNDYEAEVDKFERGRRASIRVRAYSEPILASHFGKSIMDDLYARYAKKLAEHLSKLKEEPSLFNIVISLSKK